MFQTQSSPLKVPSNVSLTKVPVRCSNPIVAPNAPFSVKVPRMSCVPRGKLTWPIPTLLLTVIVTAAGRHRPAVGVAKPSHRPSNGSAQASPASDKNNNEATDATRRRRFILSSRCCQTALFPKFVIRRGKLGHERRELLTELGCSCAETSDWRHQPSPLVITSIRCGPHSASEMSQSESEVPSRAVTLRAAGALLPVHLCSEPQCNASAHARFQSNTVECGRPSGAAAAVSRARPSPIAYPAW